MAVTRSSHWRRIPAALFMALALGACGEVPVDLPGLGGDPAVPAPVPPPPAPLPTPTPPPPPATPTPPPPTATPTPPPPPAPPAAGLSAEEQQLVDLVNEARAAVDAPPLVVDQTLMAGSRVWSAGMASRGQISHDEIRGWFSDLRAVSPACDGVGENVAYGSAYDPTTVAAGMNEQWTNSPGHYQNMVNPGFTHIGVGFAPGADGGMYGTERFAAC